MQGIFGLFVLYLKLLNLYCHCIICLIITILKVFRMNFLVRLGTREQQHPIYYLFLDTFSLYKRSFNCVFHIGIKWLNIHKLS